MRNTINATDVYQLPDYDTWRDTYVHVTVATTPAMGAIKAIVSQSIVYADTQRLTTYTACGVTPGSISNTSTCDMPRLLVLDTPHPYHIGVMTCINQSMYSNNSYADLTHVVLVSSDASHTCLILYDLHTSLLHPRTEAYTGSLHIGASSQPITSSTQPINIRVNTTKSMVLCVAGRNLIPQWIVGVQMQAMQGDGSDGVEDATLYPW